MTKEKIVEGSFLLAEIESLSYLRKMFEPHFNRKWMEEEEKIRAVSFFGIDFGKPNASEIMTRVAGNNRSMSHEIQKIINKRIDDVKKDLENL